MFQSAWDHHQYCADFHQGRCQDTVYQDPPHLWNKSTKKKSTFQQFDFQNTSSVYKVSNLFLFCITLIGFKADGPFGTETSRNVKCDVIIRISMEHVCAFCWLSFMNPFSIMHVMDSITYRTFSHIGAK
jgi:hypothetical protein